jgi:hypothetical protein
MAHDLSITQQENKEMAAAIKKINANKALKPVYMAMKEIHDNLLGNEILGRYDLGEYFASVLKPSDPKAKSNFGSDAAGTLAIGMNIRVAWLYSCQRVYNTWNREEVEKIANRTSTQGKKIQWTYLDECTNKALTKKDRNSLISRFFKEGLRVEDVKEIIQAKLGGKAGNRGGGARTSVAPRSPQAALRQLAKATKTLIDKNENWKSMFFEKVEQHPDDFADADFVDEVTAALEEQRQLEEMAAANKRRLQSVLVHAQQALGAPKGNQTPASTPVKKKVVNKAAPESTSRTGKKKRKVVETKVTTKKKKRSRTPQDAIAAARSRAGKKSREPISAA